MRPLFFIFLIVSVIIHLLLLSSFDLEKPEKKEAEPVAVQIIPKKKPVPHSPPKQEQQKEEQYPEPLKDIPELDEELETDIEEDQAAIKEQKDKKPSKRKEVAENAVPEKEKKSSLPELDEFRSDVEVPTVKAPDKDALTEEQVEGILNPKDIIEKYAKGGAEITGEDSVSMQYVKLKYQSYFHKFARRLYQVWIYPEQSAFRGEQGTVQIAFNVSKDGRISSIRVIRSSGYPDLDREAVTALKKMSGVPLPKSYELEFLRVDANFKYVLNEGFIVY
jgi:protein TonB